MRILPPLLAAALLSVPAQAASPVAGRWLTDDGKAVVTIGPCGTSVCGKITRILAATPGGAPVDENNPDPNLRKRPIQGLTVLSGFTPDGDTWKGRIYDPKAGRTYRSVLRRAGADTLEVKGCIAMFCRTQTWKRAG